MSASDDDLDLALDSVFTEAPRPPSPEPTFATYRASPRDSNELEEGGDWREIEVRLVGSHPLWGHHLWNASRAFATYLDAHRALYAGKRVLELGAGAGLPGLVAAKNGAAKVVLTDYPDGPLLDNLRFNVERNIAHAARGAVDVVGYIWGQPIEPLLDALHASTSPSASPTRRFDLLILSDLIFNHSQHDALLKTCGLALSESGTVLVFYTHHRPHLAQRDLAFFDKARAAGWSCVEILTERFPPMFPDDPGAEEVRATVHGWCLRREVVA